jgi:hypothetical protein
MTMHDSDQPIDFDSLFEDGSKLDEALAAGTFKALARHKALNQPVVTWQDGKPTWVSPDEIDLEKLAPPSLSRFD